MTRFRPAAALALAAAFAAPLAQAQEASADWDLHHDEAHDSLLAYTVFTNGLGVGFRCLDGSFGAVVSGLPAGTEPSRLLKMRFRDSEAYDTRWTNTTDPTVAVADFPAKLAREFRQGGDLRLTVPGAAEGGRNLQFAVELPPSGGAIDTVLTTCGRPLVDPRDAQMDALPESGLPVGMTWERMPRPQWPTNSPYAEGFVVTSCLTNADGSLRDCEVEMQHPQDSRFGASTLRAARRARLKTEDGSPMPTRMVSFRTNYVMR